MKLVKITDKVWCKARRESIKLGVLKNSFTNGEGNLAGMIGELVVQDYLNCKRVNTFSYDLLYKGHKIDVKTKRTSVRPEPHFTCNVSKAQKDYDTDYYFFVRVLKDYSEAYILGYLSKEDFFKNALFYKKGDDIDGYKNKTDCYAVEIQQLNTGRIK